jgi:hypothetical protein
MAKKRYIVTLTAEEREMLQTMIRSGTERARKLTRARILLKADDGWQDQAISRALDVGIATVERTRRRFVFEGLEGAPSQAAVQPQARRGTGSPLDCTHLQFAA